MARRNNVREKVSLKFSISKTELQNAIAIVIKGVSTRSTLPVLSGILLEVTGDALILQTTDLELSIQYTTAALVEEEGKAVVPGKLFSDIVKNLPDAAVHVEADEGNALITCDSSSFSIKALNYEDFPGFPHVDVSQRIEVPFTQFAAMVKRVARAVSKDESRAILTGAFVTLEDNRFKMVATDSYRLALTEVELPNSSADEFEAVISGSFLQDIASLPKTESNVQIALAENQILVSCEDTVFINRRIEGNFPNYRQIIPQSWATKTCFTTQELITAVKRVGLVSALSSPVKIDINAEAGNAIINAATQDVGSAEEVVGCEVAGESIQIALNHQYVLDGLMSVSTDQVFFETTSPMKPGIFRAGAGENFLYLVMPVRVS